MLAKLLIPMLGFSLFIQVYNQTDLIGNWRRVSHKLEFQNTLNKQTQYGDLEIRRDFTFHIHGDSSAQNSTISGWYIGDEYNGTWELRNNNRLTLWLEPKENKMLLNYKIITLTEEKLVLRLLPDTKDNRYDITYLRF